MAILEARGTAYHFIGSTCWTPSSSAVQKLAEKDYGNQATPRHHFQPQLVQVDDLWVGSLPVHLLSQIVQDRHHRTRPQHQGSFEYNLQVQISVDCVSQDTAYLPTGQTVWMLRSSSRGADHGRGNNLQMIPVMEKFDSSCQKVFSTHLLKEETSTTADRQPQTLQSEHVSLSSDNGRVPSHESGHSQRDPPLHQLMALRPQVLQACILSASQSPETVKM